MSDSFTIFNLLFFIFFLFGRVSYLDDDVEGHTLF